MKMRIALFIWFPTFLVACLLTACKSTPHRTTRDIYWVYGFRVPFVQPIKQTNIETNFFDSVDSMILEGFRDQLRAQANVSINPIAIWFLFSYPSQTDLKIESESFEDVDNESGWALNWDGMFTESNDTNTIQTVFARQKKSGINQPTVTLTMLLQIKGVNQTNYVKAELCCVWHHGTLDKHSFRIMND